MSNERTMTIGAGCSTGPAMSPGRRSGLGGACPATRAPRLQYLLPLHGQFGGSRGFEPGSFPAHLSHAGKLQDGLRRLPNMAYKRDTQLAGGPLSAIETRPNDRCARGRFAESGGKTFACANARPSCHGARVEPSSAIGLITIVSRAARGSDSARLAGSGIRRDSGSSLGAGRHGKIQNQSRPHRTGATAGTNGIETRVGNI